MPSSSRMRSAKVAETLVSPVVKPNLAASRPAATKFLFFRWLKALVATLVCPRATAASPRFRAAEECFETRPNVRARAHVTPSSTSVIPVFRRRAPTGPSAARSACPSMCDAARMAASASPGFPKAKASAWVSASASFIHRSTAPPAALIWISVGAGSI